MALDGDSTLELPEFERPPADPIELLRRWIEQADAHAVREPLALVLATTGAGGAPSTRVVLIKAVDERGVVFSSHHGSRKGRELELVPRAAGTLYWRETLQQVNLAGSVERLSEAESDALFRDRPPDAQRTTAVSQQSEPLTDERALRDAAAALAAPGEPVARPPDWGGYLIVPDRIEFWHGSPDRLHRRLSYTRDGDGWSPLRLQP